MRGVDRAALGLHEGRGKSGESVSRGQAVLPDRLQEGEEEKGKAVLPDRLQEGEEEEGKAVLIGR